MVSHQALIQSYKSYY